MTDHKIEIKHSTLSNYFATASGCAIVSIVVCGLINFIPTYIIIGINKIFKSIPNFIDIGTTIVLGIIFGFLYYIIIMILIGKLLLKKSKYNNDIIEFIVNQIAPLIISTVTITLYFTLDNPSSLIKSYMGTMFFSFTLIFCLTIGSIDKYTISDYSYLLFDNSYKADYLIEKANETNVVLTKYSNYRVNTLLDNMKYADNEILSETQAYEALNTIVDNISNCSPSTPKHLIESITYLFKLIINNEISYNNFDNVLANYNLMLSDILQNRSISL